MLNTLKPKIQDTKLLYTMVKAKTVKHKCKVTNWLLRLTYLISLDLIIGLEILQFCYIGD